MSDETGFAYELAHDRSLQEADIALSVAWYLCEKNDVKRLPFNDIVKFIEQNGIRLNLNKSRLKNNISKRTGVFRNNKDEISLSLAEMTKLADQYSRFLDAKIPKIVDSVLEKSDFTNARSYIQALVVQINGSRQFEIFDGCAVLMRRLMEVLIIDAYEATGRRDKILYNGDYMQLSGLIGELRSGSDFKLSRNAPKWLTRCKTLGDNAAHSRTYITKKLDIDDFSADYRNLISELQSL